MVERLASPGWELLHGADRLLAEVIAGRNLLRHWLRLCVGMAACAAVLNQLPVGAHLVLGDEIVAMDGKPVRSTKEFFAALDKYQVGDMVKLQIRRGGKTMEVKVNLDVAN